MQAKISQQAKEIEKLNERIKELFEANKKLLEDSQGINPLDRGDLHKFYQTMFVNEHKKEVKAISFLIFFYELCINYSVKNINKSLLLFI